MNGNIFKFTLGNQFDVPEGLVSSVVLSMSEDNPAINKL